MGMACVSQLLRWSRVAAVGAGARKPPCWQPAHTEAPWLLNGCQWYHGGGEWLDNNSLCTTLHKMVSGLRCCALGTRASRWLPTHPPGTANLCAYHVLMAMENDEEAEADLPTGSRAHTRVPYPAYKSSTIKAIYMWAFCRSGKDGAN
jgi:hypothetical protein